MKFHNKRIIYFLLFERWGLVSFVGCLCAGVGAMSLFPAGMEEFFERRDKGGWAEEEAVCFSKPSFFRSGRK